MTRRRIAIVTTSRADYGHLYWLIRDTAADPRLELQLVVAAMHLDPRFGQTVTQIEADGLAIAARVPMLMAGDDGVAAAQSIGVGTLGFTDALARLRPDMMVVLGDRFEILAAVSTALMLGIPIAHIHGGELTEGAIDDSVRHAVSKMAALHFVAAEPYARRLRQMGEDPARVFVSGAPGLDHAARSVLADRTQLAARLNRPDLPDPILAVTFHPVTRDPQATLDGMRALTQALDAFPQAQVVITGVNADPQHGAVTAWLEEWSRHQGPRVAMTASLGQAGYLGLLRLAAAVVGNSSSGLIEAPFFGVPTVNIGNRQGGRLRADSVIDCGEDSTAIVTAITQALSPSFRALAATAGSPLGSGDASGNIRQVLAEIPLSGLTKKRFHDVDMPS